MITDEQVKELIKIHQRMEKEELSGDDYDKIEEITGLEWEDCHIRADELMYLIGGMQVVLSQLPKVLTIYQYNQGDRIPFCIARKDDVDDRYYVV